MPQLVALDDNRLEITVAAAPEVGLDETDINSGHLNSPFQFGKPARLHGSHGLVAAG
jgi:hypothetical protein